MFCGPHEDGKISYRRVNIAIGVAHRLQLPLVLTGDGNQCRDLLEFERVARNKDVEPVLSLYDHRASTLADAQLVTTLLATSEPFTRVTTIHLVTDYWHMPRAKYFLDSLLRDQVKGRDIELMCVCVRTPEPSMEVLSSERKGIEDFAAGTYAFRADLPQFGKPASPASLPFTY